MFPENLRYIAQKIKKIDFIELLNFWEKWLWKIYNSYVCIENFLQKCLFLENELKFITFNKNRPVVYTSSFNIGTNVKLCKKMLDPL